MDSILNRKVNRLINSTKATLLSSNTLYKGSFITILEEKYLLPNNKMIKREKAVKNNGKEAVLVVAVTENKKIILVVQNRVSNITSIEFPAGYIEEGESIIQAGARELKEETGYISNDIKFLDQYYSQLGSDSSVVNIVIAYRCKKVGEQNLGENEYINYDEFTLEEVKELIENHLIVGVGSKLAFYEGYPFI